MKVTFELEFFLLCKQLAVAMFPKFVPCCLSLNTELLFLFCFRVYSWQRLSAIKLELEFICSHLFLYMPTVYICPLFIYAYCLSCSHVYFCMSILYAV